MPEDPLAPAPIPTVEAATTTSSPRRPWPPWVILIAVALLITAVNAVVLRPEPPSEEAARFVPADGSVSYQQVTTSRGGRTTAETQAVESARYLGLNGLLSVEPTLSTRVLAAIDPDTFQTVRLWRTTSTRTRAPAAGRDGSSTALYRVDGAVEQLASTSTTEGVVYVPALTVLPADVTNGSRWTSAGSAGDDLDYQSEFTALTTPLGCLSSRGTIRYTDRVSGKATRTKAVEQTWCPSRGLLASTESVGGLIQKVTEAAAPSLAAANTQPGPATPPVEGSWTPRPVAAMSNNPQFGRGEMNGSTTAQPAPVMTASGVIVRVGIGQADLVAQKLEAGGTTAVTLWRAHPGGTILSLAGFGDVVVATTTDRRMVAYDSRGLRHWSQSFADLAPAAPVRAGPDRMILVDLAGAVRSMMITTGQLVWERDLRIDVNRGPAVGEEVVVILDRGGTVRALDLSTGVERWAVDLEGKDAVVVRNTVVTLQDQTVIGLGVDDGQRRWRRPVLGTYTQMSTIGDAVAVATKQETLIVGDDGRIRARRSAGFGLTRTADRLIIWGRSVAEIVDASGAVNDQWAIPALTNVTDARPGLAYPGGVLLFDSNWPFLRWSA